MKKFWLRILSFFNKTKAFVFKYAKPSVKLVENLKMVIDSPVADVLTAIIPSQIDDLIKDKLRKALPVVLVNLQIARDCEGCTPEEVLQKAIAALAAYAKQDKHKAYTNIATELALQISGKQAGWDKTSDLIVETYKKYYKKD